MMNEYELMGIPYFRVYPAWYRLGLHKINDRWTKAIRNPFQIQSFFEYCIERYCVPKNLNPCGEITIGKREVCSLRPRAIESPFSLTSFTELFVIGPWEADQCSDAFFRFAMEPQHSLSA